MAKPKTETSESVRQARKRYWKKHRDKIIAKRSTPEYIENRRQWQRERYKTLRNDPAHRAMRHAYSVSEGGKVARRAAEKRRRLKKKQEVFDALGGVCKRCGFSDQRALQVDHINGGGWSYGKKGNGRNGNSVFPKILKNLEHFQLLCANCNWIKREENREYGAGYKERVAAVCFKG